MSVERTDEADVGFLLLDPQLQAMGQVAKVLSSVTGLTVTVSPDGRSFRAARTDRLGILAAEGALNGPGRLLVRLEVVRCRPDQRAALGRVLKGLAALGDKCRLVPAPADAGEEAYAVEMGIQAVPLSPAREGPLREQLKAVDRLAASIQAELPHPVADADLLKLYQPVAELLDPVRPLPPDAGDLLPAWCRELLDLLDAAATVALVAPCEAAERYVLSALATAARPAGRTLGRAKVALNGRSLVELVRKAPGTVVVSATTLSLGSNPYELATETQATQDALALDGKPVIVTGTMESLQAVFSGGQGGRADPLRPVVCRCPDLPLEPLVRLALHRAGAAIGGLPPRILDRLLAVLMAALSHFGEVQQKELIIAASRQAVAAWHNGVGPDPATFTAHAAGLVETLAGLSPRPRVKRSETVDARYVKGLTDPRLLPFLREHLVGQDEPLAALTRRLTTEALMRPQHQPIRIFSLGASGTGKSESARLLARWLDLPYLNVDAASLSDYHTASAQLLGAGRGIVSSYQAGRLEQAAKHHTGVVLEISDLDHANPTVRSFLGDLFLQVLDTGEAQSGTGCMFSCSGMILFFTMNLPDGADERLHSPLGFGSARAAGDVAERAATEVKRLVSAAFVGRVGSPIVFAPLPKDALAEIVERAVRAALIEGAARLGTKLAGVTLAWGLGRAALDSLPMEARAFGARVMLEHARGLAAEALLPLLEGTAGGLDGKTLRVSMARSGGFELTVA